MTFVAPLHLLKASAGSGKTFALTLHYIGLILQHKNTFREILALTFTNKATAEMKNRILEVLEGLALDDDAAFIEAYRQQLLAKNPKWHKEDIQKRAHECYREILHHYHYFSVFTIDGFSQRVIRAFLFELGIDHLVHIELKTEKVKKDLIRRLYEKLGEHPVLLDWVVQRMEMKLEDGQAWNIEKDLSALAKLIFSEDFLAFDDRLRALDANELFQTVSAYNKEIFQAFESTFHAYLKEYKEILQHSGIQPVDLVNKTKNKIWCLEKVTLKSKMPEVRKKLEEVVDQSIHYQIPKTDNYHQALYAQLNPLFTQFQSFLLSQHPIYALAKAVQSNLHYLLLLKEMSALLADWRQDHQSQLLSDAQLLLQKIGQNEHGDPTFIWEKMGNKFRYFLYDEFQDTSRQQWNNFKPLLFNAISASTGQKREHLIVGDVKQSIYRWRNGDFRLLLQGIEDDIKKHFHLEHSERLISHGELLENYRSDAAIIDFNNFLFTHLPALLASQINQIALQAFGEEVYEQFWVKERYDSMLPRAYADAVQRLPAHKLQQQDGKIRIEHILDPELRSNSINKEGILEKTFTQIQTWLTTGQYSPQQIGLLVRSNKEATVLVEYFQAMQVETGYYFPFVSGESMKLWNNTAVRIIIQSFRFLLQSNAKNSLYLTEMAYYYCEWRQIVINEDQWMRLANGDISQVSDVLPPQITQHWSQLPTLPLLELFEQLIQSFGLREDPAHTPYLLALGDLLFQQVQKGETDLPSFLDFWEEEEENWALPSGEDGTAVEIITIHKSKGLAFDAVIIPFGHWDLGGKLDNQIWIPTEQTAYAAFGTLPLPWHSLKESALREHYYTEYLYNYMDALNTLYVATTRAKHELVLYIGHKKTKEGLRTIGDALLDLLPLYNKGSIQTEPFLLEVDNPSPHPVKARFQQEKAYYLTAKIHSGSLDQLLANHRLPKQNTLLSGHESVAFGQQLHELVAQANNPQQLKELLQEYYQSGLLTTAQVPLVEKWLLLAQQHPVLGNLWEADVQHLTEQAIVDTQGATWRPDKILKSATETWLIDYKLSAQLSTDSHQQQIRQYASLLLEMGYPQVRGHLYYFMQNAWIEVI